VFFADLLHKAFFLFVIASFFYPAICLNLQRNKKKTLEGRSVATEMEFFPKPTVKKLRPYL